MPALGAALPKGNEINIILINTKELCVALPFVLLMIFWIIQVANGYTPFLFNLKN